MCSSDLRMPRWVTQDTTAGVRDQNGTLSSFSVERCPPSQRNGVRDGAEYALRHYAALSARVAALGTALSVFTPHLDAPRFASGQDGPSKSQHDDFVAATQKQHSLTVQIMASTNNLTEPSARALESAH